MFPHVLLKPLQESSDSNHMILYGQVDKFSKKRHDKIPSFKRAYRYVPKILSFKAAVFSNYDSTYYHQKAKQIEN